MQVKWNNLIALALLTVMVVMVISNLEAISGTFAGLRDIGVSHRPEDRFYGIAVLGLLLVTIIAIVKIMTHNGRRES